ncbi:MAG: hypothetical protein IMX03_07425 [Brockia lithotrophica]|nr:hypothetical protein [Brockia lithotrophica]
MEGLSGKQIPDERPVFLVTDEESAEKFVGLLGYSYFMRKSEGSGAGFFTSEVIFSYFVYHLSFAIIVR